MSEKMTCQGCNAHTSSVRAAFLDGEPCPYCGLSAGSAQEAEVANPAPDYTMRRILRDRLAELVGESPVGARR